MRVLYLTQWFEPEPIFKGIGFARGLQDHDHIVDVLTGFPNYPGGRLYDGYKMRPYRGEKMDGIRVHRVPLFPSHDRSPGGRVTNYLSFFFSALLFGLLRAWRFDLIYVYHPPVTPTLAAAIFAAFWGKPFVMEIQDLWPDSVVASGMASRRIVRILDRFCTFAYRRASHIVVQSPGMRTALVERGISPAKISVISNWATYRPEVEAGVCAPQHIVSEFPGHINVVYGGNLGQAQGIFVLIDAAVIAHGEDSRIKLHLIGDGIERDTLAEDIDRLGVGEFVKLHPPVDRKAMDRVFDAADILVLHLRDLPLYKITIPSKVQHYLACGKPIVAGVCGDASDILRASQAAQVCLPDKSDAIANALLYYANMSEDERRAVGYKATAFYEENFSFDRAIKTTSDQLEMVASNHLGGSNDRRV